MGLLAGHGYLLQPTRSLALRKGNVPLAGRPVQIGHFLGLAHPFPDGSHGRGSCEEGGADGDGIPDTPRQYAPNSGCSLDGGMHVCTGEDGPLPVNNLMDHTNDTCR